MKPLNSTRIQNAFLCLCNELEGNQNHPCDSSDLAVRASVFGVRYNGILYWC